ncbi:MAG: S8 family serine peptidase [Methanobacteriota archaeon]
MGNERTIVGIAVLLFVAGPMGLATGTSDVELGDPLAYRTPGRFTVGFHAFPVDLEPGDTYQGDRVLAVDPTLRFAVVESADPLALSVRLALDENVRYFHPDPVGSVIADFVPNDPRYGAMYGPQQIGAPAAWDTTLGATSVILCTTDTGVRRTHEDLGTARYGGGFDFVNNDNDPADDQGHGTHVTGTATATTNNALGIAGVALTTYKHAKVLNAAGSGTWSGVASGIRWCADNGAHVQSASLGGSGGATELLDAVNYAWNAGVVNVASAGNSGCDPCVGFPAAYTNEIAVACTTSTKSLCSFSSRGPEVDLAAPGNAIDSTCYTADNAYCSKSGTSMSAPHVAGAAALLKAANAALTNADIRSALETNAEDLGTAGKDNSFGWGLVRPDLSMGPPLPPPPTSTSHVAGISGSFTHGKANKHDVRCDVSVADQNNAAVSGATVSLTWTKPGGATSAQQAATGGTGVATFVLGNQRTHGTYTCAVTDITATGYAYDPASNVVTSLSVSVT